MSAHHPKGRFEDARLIRGRGRYAADWNLPGQLHAQFVRADRAHARLAGVDVAAALAHPGVVRVLTAADAEAAGFRSLPTLMPVKGVDGADMKAPFRPVLAHGRVRYVGEPVALVVAESRAAAQDAAEAVAIAYEDLPAVTDARAALAAGAPQLHDDVPGNHPFEFATGDADATAAAFARAARVVRLTLDIPRVVANPMEPRAALAQYDAAEDAWVLHACTQGAFHMRTQIAGVLGVPPERVRVVAEDVGGSFGVHSNAYPEDCALLLAARLTGRPVKWNATRSETFLSDEQGRGTTCLSELALDAGGRFLGLRFRFVANLGAYLTLIGPIANSLGATTCLTGVYAVPAASARVSLALTNTVPAASYRGAGRPLMAYAVERVVDQAAHELGIDAAELRRINLVPRDAFPYKLPNGTTYDCGDFATVLGRATAAADWPGFAARRAASAVLGRLRGRGLSVYIEASGAGFVPKDQVQIRFGRDAQGALEVTLHTASHAHGQGHETSFAQIVAGELGIAPARVRLVTAAAGAPFLIGNLTSGARTLAGIGSVLLLAAREVVQRGRAPAAAALGCDAAALRFETGTYRDPASGGGIGLEELALRHPGGAGHPLSLDFESKFGSTFPNGCHVVEVEIDAATGTPSIASFVACDDIGNIVNHQIVEGQIHGGLAQGAGEVFGEEAVYDPASGQLLSGSFLDYPMPRAGWIGALEIIDAPVPTASNPLGAKGAGEAGTTGSLPALMNAVADALRTQGVARFDMPATPARLWRALAAAAAGDTAAVAVAPLDPVQP